MFLEKELFQQVVAATPLVSVDLIVRNSSGLVLLGKRLNRPAQGYWFVPGGRICKGEALADAFKRLTLAELGQELDYTQARLIGAFDHFYDDSVFGSTPSTHYVALGHEVLLEQVADLPLEQHNAYQWMSVEELLSRPDVHRHTKLYFLSGPDGLQ
ncbi:GDP-mannose mannosyl hydrolase [Rheinheimera marina]|uniref:GDP-mannose mannosyl hydrolase n=1 Tax=Rheinheimera marina TaxID=1774958 RepID=A0ABV9JR83_9GAMM